LSEEGNEDSWLYKQIKWKLGKGTKIIFWEDRWFNNQVLKQEYPMLYLMTIRAIYTIGRQMVRNGMELGSDWRRQIFEREREEMDQFYLYLINMKPQKDNGDKVVWLAQGGWHFFC